MKVFENIDAFRRERLALAGLGDNGMEFFTSELKRVITDLIPMRKSRQATEVYFQNNLCHDENVRKFEESIANRRLNGEDVQDDEYRATKQECRFSEDILHTVLIRVLKDDRYSFGNLYWLLCSRYNRQVGYAYYDDIVVSNQLIEYAVDFDIEELQQLYQNGGDIIDRIDLLEMSLIKSKNFEADSTDEVLLRLKNRYESAAKDMISMLEKKLERLGYSGKSKVGQVSEKPFIEDSIGFIESGKTYYLTYYDFVKCPIDVSQYPFSVHLGNYKIVRTERGLEDATPIFVKILNNTYKQVGYANGEGAEVIFRDTRELLHSLFGTFMRDAVQVSNGDFEQEFLFAKWWSLHTARCLNDAFSNDILPESNEPLPEFGVPNYKAEVWKRCDFFRKSMTEYCLCMTIEYTTKMKGNPHSMALNVVPYNYYGKDFDGLLQAAKNKRLKTEADREVTEYFSNCKHFRSYIEGRLFKLNGKEINDPTAVAEKHKLASDLIEMANDYLDRLDKIGVTDPYTLKYAIELWNWFERETMNYLIENVVSRTRCSCLPSELATEEESEIVANTALQYLSFRKLYNPQMAKAQHELFKSFAEMAPEGNLANKEGVFSTEETVEETGTEGSDTRKEKRGKPRKAFKDSVVVVADTDKLLQVLHSMIDGKCGDNVYRILYAAFKGGLIIKPSYNATIDEFGITGAESGYNNFFRKQSLSQEEITPIVARIKREMEAIG